MSTDYTNEGQQRILKLLSLLSGNEVTGLSPSQIAKLQGCSPSVVTRDLDNLRTAGFAEQVPDSGNWRLSPQLVQISLRLAAALQTARSRIDELAQRHSRT